MTPHARHSRLRFTLAAKPSRIWRRAAPAILACALAGCGSSGTASTTARTTVAHTAATTKETTGASPTTTTATTTTRAAAAVTAATHAPASCFTITMAARYAGYAVANFGNSDVPVCRQQTTNATFVVRKIAGAWKVINPSGTVSCPIHGLSNRVAAALGIPC
jgi:hypothetical protein